MATGVFFSNMDLTCLFDAQLAFFNVSNPADILSVIIHSSLLLKGFNSTEDILHWPADRAVVRLSYYPPEQDEKYIKLALAIVKVSERRLLIHCFVESDDNYSKKELTVEFDLRHCDGVDRQMLYSTVCLRMVNPITEILSKRSKSFHAIHFLALPLELKAEIMSYMSAQSLARLSSTCRLMYSIGTLDYLWKPLFLKRYSSDSRYLLSSNPEEVVSNSFYQLYCKYANGESSGRHMFTASSLLRRLPSPWSPFGLFRRDLPPLPFFRPSIVPNRPFLEIENPERSLLPKMDFYHY